MDDTPAPYLSGAAYVDGRTMPVADAAIPITDWGYRHSDATYDVVSVRHGAFFRLDAHIHRFRASMDALRMQPRESDEEIKAILHRCVALAGLRDAYVAVDCLRGAPAPGMPRHPAFSRSYIAAFAVPWVSLATPEEMETGLHLIVAETMRIPPEAVDPRAKNFHWADLTRAQFEARDRGAHFAVLPDAAGNVTEGAGFNVFSITDGRIATPDRGVLEGITRQSIVDLCTELAIPCEIRPVLAGELREADEILICSTAGGPMPVSRIDGRIMGNDRPGPITMRLIETYWAKRAAGWGATPVNYAAAS